MPSTEPSSFWKGQRVPRPLPLRAPWLLSPTWTRDLRKPMTGHTNQIRPHIVTFQSPSTAVVFTKNPSVMDRLCNHKDLATRWADGEEPICTCATLRPYLLSPPSTSSTHHIHLNGDSLNLDDPPLSSIATGSLQNKIFPTKKEIWKSLQDAFVQWHRRNAIPSLPTRHLDTFWNTSWTRNTPITFIAISHIVISRSLSNSFQARFSTTRTSVLLLCASFALVFTLNAWRPPLRTLRSSNAWTSLQAS